MHVEKAKPRRATRFEPGGVPAYRPPRIRYQRSPPRKSPFVLFKWIAVAIGILALVDLLLVANQMRLGRDHLLAGVKILQLSGTTLSSSQATNATTDFDRAAKEFSSAHRSLAGDPLFLLFGILPITNHQVQASRALADMGAQASRAGQLGVQVVNVLLSEHEVGQGSDKKAPGERLLALLKAVDPKLNQIGSTLRALQMDRAAIPSSGLLPPISGAVKLFDAKFGAVPAAFNTFRTVEPGLYAILGSAGPQSYLVLQQDPAEIRAGGGFIGSVGYLNLDHGKMAPYQPHDVYEIDGTGTTVKLGLAGGPKYVAPPAPLDRFIYPSSWELRDSNWWPDFPTSARQAQFFYERETGHKASGVITIDPFVVSNILGVIGPVKIPETGDTVTAQNFFLKTIERVQLHKGTDSQKSFLTYAGKPILDRLFSLPSRQWVPLLRLVDQACRARSVQAYFDDAASEALVSQFRCDGRLQPLAADGLLVVDTNLDGNKDDFWVKRDFKLSLVVNADGSARHTLRLHYSGYPQLANITGPYIGWLRVYLPRSARLVGSSGANLRTSSDLGRAVAQGWLEWPFNKSMDVTLVYDVDAVAMQTSGGMVNVYWQKQAGRLADPISVVVQVPKTWRPVGATLGSSPVRGSSVTTDLASDREFRFLYQPS